MRQGCTDKYYLKKNIKDESLCDMTSSQKNFQKKKKKKKKKKKTSCNCLTLRTCMHAYNYI